MNTKTNINEFSYFEVMDRTWVIINLLNNTLGEHPVIKSNKKSEELYDKAQSNLNELYQHLSYLDKIHSGKDN